MTEEQTKAQAKNVFITSYKEGMNGNEKPSLFTSIKNKFKR